MIWQLTFTRTPLQQARLAQLLTLGWMVLEAAIAVAAGIAAGSVALTAFGADSLLELFTAGVVLRLLLRRQDGHATELLDGAERRASRLVGWALYAVTAYIVLSSSTALLWGRHPEASPAGMALTIVSLGVMAFLWRWRLRLAQRLNSPALRGDAACSAACLYMAAVTLGGLALNQAFGWWWADPVAALALIWWLRGQAAEALEAARTGAVCCEDGDR